MATLKPLSDARIVCMNHSSNYLITMQFAFIKTQKGHSCFRHTKYRTLHLRHEAQIHRGLVRLFAKIVIVAQVAHIRELLGVFELNCQL